MIQSIESIFITPKFGSDSREKHVLNMILNMILVWIIHVITV